MSLTDFVFTDDEVIAVAAAAERAWPGPLPTLSGSDAEALTLAGRRGVRSLFARAIDRESAGALFARLSDVSRRFRTFLADENLLPVRGSMLACAYSAKDGCTVEVVQPDGLHRFFEMETATLLEVLETFLATEGTQGPGRPCIVSEDDSAISLFVADNDEVLRYEADPSGSTQRPPGTLTHAEAMFVLRDHMVAAAFGTGIATDTREGL